MNKGCPILNMTDCQQNKCMFWNEQEQKCAINMIAEGTFIPLMGDFPEIKSGESLPPIGQSFGEIKEGLKKKFNDVCCKCGKALTPEELVMCFLSDNEKIKRNFAKPNSIYYCSECFINEGD